MQKARFLLFHPIQYDSILLHPFGFNQSCQCQAWSTMIKQKVIAHLMLTKKTVSDEFDVITVNRRVYLNSIILFHVYRMFDADSDVNGTADA